MLCQAGLATKIWVHDHDPDNKGGMARVNELLTMDGVADAIDGVAWHCYTSAATATNLAPVKAAHPKLRFYHTENGPHVVFNSWRTEWWWAEKVFGMLQNGCEMFVSWCLCLDELGTPMTGSHLCAGFTVVDSTTHEVTYSRATLPATTLRLGASGTLDLGGTSQTFASLVGSGCVTNGSLALTSSGAIYPGGVGTTGTLALDVASFTAPAGTTLAVDVGDRVDVSCAVDISGWNLSVSNPESLTGDGHFVVMKARFAM